MGSEATSELYLAGMVAVFREVRRVLAPWGTLWCNVGDTYGGSNAPESQSVKQRSNTGSIAGMSASHAHDGNLVGIPERLALALQKDGWMWRSTVIWAKPSPMPESVGSWRWEQHRVKAKDGSRVRISTLGGTGNAEASLAANSHDPGPATTDPWAPCPGCAVCSPNDGLVLRKGSWRTTKSFEYLYQFTKGMGYWSDAEAVKEKAAEPERQRKDMVGGANGHTVRHSEGAVMGASATRNPRSVQSFGGERMGELGPYVAPNDTKHFAAFVVELADFCIRASCPERVCAKCQAPWAPVVERKNMEIKRTDWGDKAGNRTASSGTMTAPAESRVLGQRPTCACGDVGHVPGLVLDIFGGTMTTGVAALRLGRRFLGIELSAAYVALGEARIRADSPLWNGVHP